MMPTKISGQHIFFLPKLKIPRQLKESKEEYTFLSEALISKDEIIKIWEVLGGKVKNVVPLKPSRIILHALAVTIQCYIKQEKDPSVGDETFKKMVSNAYEEIKKTNGYTQLETELKHFYQDLNLKIKEYLRTGKSKEFHKREIKILKKLKHNSSEAMIQGVQALIYNKYAQRQAHKYAYSMLVEKSTLLKLPLLPKKETIALFTTGGPASGKTSSLHKIAQMVEKKYGVQWDEIVHMDGDRTRTVLTLNGYSADLALDESRLIGRTQKKLLSKAEYSQSRHQLIDAPKLNHKIFLKQVRPCKSYFLMRGVY